MSCNVAEYNLCVNQYATFKVSLQLTDESGSALSIASWSFSGSIKETVASTTESAIFNITANTSSATIDISLLPHQTALLTKTKYVYDIIAGNVSPNPDEVYRIISGKVAVSPGVTVATSP